MYIIHKCRPLLVMNNSINTSKLVFYIFYITSYYVFQYHFNILIYGLTIFINTYVSYCFEQKILIYIFLSWIWNLTNLISFSAFCYYLTISRVYPHVKTFFEQEEKRMMTFRLWDLFGVLFAVINYSFFVYTKHFSEPFRFEHIVFGEILTENVNNYIKYEFDASALETYFCTTFLLIYMLLGDFFKA